MVLYIKDISKSQVREFVNSSGEWQNRRILSQWDNTTGFSAAVGTVCHKFVETFLLSGDFDASLDHAYKCIYQCDGEVYVIDPDKVKLEEDSKEDILKNYATKKVSFGKKTIDNLLDSIRKGIANYAREKYDYGDILGVEQKISGIIKDTLGNGMVVSCKLPFTAVIDVASKLKTAKNIPVEGKIERIEAGEFFVTDQKFTTSFSSPEIENPDYFFQAFFNYYTMGLHYGKFPKYMVFLEIKISENRDESSQHQSVIFPFFGETFELYKVFFWRFMNEVIERMEMIQERDLLFNPFDMTFGKKEWEKQKEFYMNIKQGTLKSNIMILQKKNNGSKVQQVFTRVDPVAEKLQIQQNLKNTDIVELTSIEHKIRLTFREFGVLCDYVSKKEGFAYDLYLYLPKRGVPMGKIPGINKNICQTLGIESVTIHAPLLGTNYVGVEVPCEKRTYCEYEKDKKREKGFFYIGKNIQGDEIKLSFEHNPHLLIAGRTGSGKSKMLEVLIYQVKNQGRIILIDPKKIGLRSVEKYSDQYIDDTDRTIIYLYRLRRTMFSRFEKMQERGIDNWDGEKIFVFIDEFNQFMLQDKETKNVFENLILEITNLGRAAGIHLILATQRPSREVINGRIKGNISTRICFSVGQEVDSRVVLDESGAEKLLGSGDGIYKNDGIVGRFQSYYLK